MASYTTWHEHFDKISVVILNKRIAAIDVLTRDSLIQSEYGSDLGTLRQMMKTSISLRK